MRISFVAAAATISSRPLYTTARSSAAAFDYVESKGQGQLLELLQTHADVVDDYFPNKDALDQYEQYVVSIPPIEDYVISMLVNPCGSNGTYGREDNLALGYDCCTDRFGAGEYAYKPGSRNRHSNGYSNGLPLPNDEPFHNIEAVDEFGNLLEYKYSRRPEDEVHIDESCTGLREPHSACIADRFAASASKLFPACWDHNETVDATLDCYTPKGKRNRYCMQISYSQNAYIPICGGAFANDDTCGAFLEVHKANGSPNDDETTILSDVRLTTHATNGMQTTTLPLTYKGDPKRLLCSYEEIDLRVGSMVKIKSNAATCCCPRMLSINNRSSKLGAFFCPKNKRFRDGPFTPKLTNLDELYPDDTHQRTFPLCPAFEDGKDVLMCTQERALANDIPLDHPGSFFSRPCTPLSLDEGDEFTSNDLFGKYANVCPLGDAFTGCGISVDECQGPDQKFSFKDEIGKVVTLPKTSRDKYGVTFNDGRSVYRFSRDELEFLKPPFNYEVWFVKRNRFEKIVEKKKPFRVIWPRCTYDKVNGRYFPFAQLDEEGKLLVSLE